MDPVSKASARKSNLRHNIFAAEYVQDLNATRAAIAAGYSPKGADVRGSELLSNRKVRALIDRNLSRKASKLDLSSERILEELSKIAFLDPRSLFNDDGTPKNISEIEESAAMAITSIDIEDLYDQFGDGKAEKIGVVKKMKFESKLKALELLGKYRKLFTEKIEVTGMEGLAERLNKIRSRKSGDPSPKS